METSLACEQKYESQDECKSEAGVSPQSNLTEITTLDECKGSGDLKDLQNSVIMEKLCSTPERTESHDEILPPRICATSTPADGDSELKMEDITSEHALKVDKWPPVPALQGDGQPTSNESVVIEIQEGLQETSDVLATVQDSNDETPATENLDQDTQVSTNQRFPCSNEEDDVDSPGTSVVKSTKDDENVECKTVNSTTIEQLMRRDCQCDEAPYPAFSKSPTKRIVTETHPPLSTECESTSSSLTLPIVHQGAPEGDSKKQNENDVGKKGHVEAPPLETEVLANPVQGGSMCVTKEEPLVTAEGRRESEREGSVHDVTGEERKQTVCFTQADGNRPGEVKDQTGENKGQTAESPSKENGRLREEKLLKMQVDHLDDSQSDSGVSADFSLNCSADFSDQPVNTDASLDSESPANETPIEREIRLAVRREQSLRRSRGLSGKTDRTEFVEIPLRKPILSPDFQFKSMPSPDKDRQFAGKKMQKEISAETDREKALVELGRLPGFYDKGTEVHLQEKKQIFETFQDPRDAVAGVSRRTTTELQEVDSAVNVRQRLLQFSQNSPNPLPADHLGDSKNNLTTVRGPGLTEGVKSQVIIIEANSTPATSRTDGGSQKVLKSKSVRSSSAEPPCTRLEDDDSGLVKDNPFFKLRSSMCQQSQVEQDIMEAKERERELRQQRTSLYGVAAMGLEDGRTMQTYTRRDESRLKEVTFSPPPHLSSTSYQSELSMFSSHASARQSTGKLDRTWPPSQACEQQQSEKTLKIQRQRNPLLDRWESGRVNGHAED